MRSAIRNILILCTGNSARSILAESLFNNLPTTKGKFRAYSAGSFPKSEVNPLVIELLKQAGFPTENLRNKSWDEFTRADAPTMDFVITVCDQAAGEQCPFWPGHPVVAHWSMPDPAAVLGSNAEKYKAFKDVMMGLTRRIELFASLPLESLDHLALKIHMAEIGRQ